MQRGHSPLIWRTSKLSSNLNRNEADLLPVILWLFHGLVFAQVRTTTDDIAHPASSEQTTNVRDVTTTKGNPEEVIRWRQEAQPTHQGSYLASQSTIISFTDRRQPHNRYKTLSPFFTPYQPISTAQRAMTDIRVSWARAGTTARRYSTYCS